MSTKPDTDRIYPFLLSWILVSSFFLIIRHTGLFDLQGKSGLAAFAFIDAVLLIWVLINRIKNRRLLRPALILFTALYFTLAAVFTPDQWFGVGLCAAMGIIIFSIDVKEIRFKAGKKAVRNIVLFLSILFVILVGVNCSLVFLDHWAPNFDFGIFSQMFHYMKETGIPFTTCERDGLLSHFAVHVSPIYYMILPIYCLFPDPVTLEITQSIIVVSGIIPLLLIMKRHSLGKTAMILFSLMYLFFPGFAGGCFWHIHENCFLAPLALWFIYFSEKESWCGQAVFAMLTLAVKEDAAVYVAVTALYFLLTRKNRICNLCILAASVLYFAGITHYLKLYGDGVQVYRYSNYLIDGEGTMAILTTVISDPVYVIKQLMEADKLKFIFMTLMPMGFLPLITKNFRRAILLIPWILINLMPNVDYQYSMNFHYCFGSCALLIYLAFINYTDMTESRRKKLLLYSACSTIIMCTCVNYYNFTYFKNFLRPDEKRTKVSYAVSLVPKEASVAAGTFLVADFSDHDVVYELELTDEEAEYYVLDFRQPTDGYDVNDFLNDKYETVYYEPEVIAVFRNLEQQT